MNTKMLQIKESDIDKLYDDNAKLRGALLEMLTSHGYNTLLILLKYECDCHACTNARKLLAGE